jgi:hypothetical protein
MREASLMPALLASHNVNSPSTGTATLTSPTITPSAGDLIVVKGCTSGYGEILNTPTDTQGNTYTQRAVTTVVGHTFGAIWTAVAGTGASMTVSVTVPDACDHSMVVERWASAALDVTPVINGTKTGAGLPLSTIVTTQPYSVVTWCNGDGPGEDPTGRTYNGTSATPTEDGLHDLSSSYVAYYAYQQAISAGSVTLGITSPGGQTWALVGMEILDVPSGTSPDQTNAMGPLAWQ